MGAKADIDAAIDQCRGAPPQYRLRLGASAARAFLADLCHEGVLPPPAVDGRSDAALPEKYRLLRIETVEDFDGWEVAEV